MIKHQLVFISSLSNLCAVFLVDKNKFLLLLSFFLWLGDIVPEQSVPSLPERTSSFEKSQPTGEDDELSDENETSEGDQPPLPECDQLKEQMEGQSICLTIR